ncbi:MAG: cell division protein FtsQ/DivIB [Patescibacteria group bacterium]
MTNRNFVARLLLAVFFLLVILMLGSWLFLHLLLIKNVKCQLKDASEIECHGTDSLLGKPLFLIDPDKILLKERLKVDQQSSFFVVDYRKILPSTLVLVVEKKQVIFRLLHQDQRYLIDEQGSVLPDDSNVNSGPSQDLPRVYLRESWLTDQMANSVEEASFQEIASLLKELDDKKINFDDVTLYDSTSVALQIEQWQVLIDSKADHRQKAEQLYQLLHQYDLDSLSQTVVEIDLRYNLPVLRTTRTSFD